MWKETVCIVLPHFIYETSTPRDLGICEDPGANSRDADPRGDCSLGESKVIYRWIFNRVEGQHP